MLIVDYYCSFLHVALQKGTRTEMIVQPKHNAHFVIPIH